MKKITLDAQTKLLIIIVLVLLVGVGYYFLVYKAMNDAESAARADIQLMQQEIDAENAKVANIKVRKDEIEAGKKLKGTVQVANNSNAESAFISRVLKKNTVKFSNSFNNEKSDSTYVRREVNVSYTAPDYTHARAALNEIIDGDFRNIVTGMTIEAKGDNGFSGTGEVSCTFTVTFIESVKDTTAETTATAA